MANSTYYYNLYKNKKKEVKKHEDDIDDLRDIYDNLTSDLNDEIRNVNTEIENLKEDLRNGVRHNLKYDANTNNLTTKKEKGASADGKLVSVGNEIQEEIRRLENLKNSAASDRDYYYKKYKEKKDEERKELLEKIGLG